MVLPVGLMSKATGFEVGLEELLQEVVIEVALREVFDQFLSYL
jgi:hypothetical protein